MERISIMSMKVDDVTLPEAVAFALRHMETQTRCRVVTPNAEFGRLCERDASFREIINSSELILPDGVGVLHAARILGTPLRQKVAGIEFAEALIDAMQDTGLRVFFLGGKPGVAQKAAERMTAKYPGLLIEGVHDGYYGNEEQVLRVIRRAAPDALFVCLGAPRQELFIHKYGSTLGVSLMCGLGGTFDTWAGDAKRAPQWMIGLGLEWLYRMLTVRGRVGRTLKLPLYLLNALLYKWRGGGADASR